MVEPYLNIGARRIAMIGITAFLIAGCGRSELNTQYGKISGSQGSDSVNGVSILADMFAARGFKVKRRQKISPGISRFGTIVWFPDDYSCPSEKAIEALNSWLDAEKKRTLIYVGRDYDSRIDYLEDVLDSAPANQKEELLRQRAEGKVFQARRYDISPLYWFEEDTTECEWFEKVDYRRRKSTLISGVLSAGVDSGAAELELSTVLKPIVSQKSRWEAESQLDADGQPFVFQLTDRTSAFENSLFVISNGSFLLNYALIQKENRQLASNLIDQCDRFEDVLFLESGPRGIDVSDSDTNNHNNWAWIAEPPLRYIVPHFLMWGILFCFVFFPIFGRPKRVKRRNTSTIRTHVDAMGKLISRSDLPDRATNKIHEYQRMTSSESNRNRHDQ